MIEAYFNTSVTHKATLGKDQWGTPLGTDAGTTRKARVESRSGLTINQRGEEVRYAVSLYLAASVSVDYDDVFTVDSVDRRVQSIETPTDFVNQYQIVRLA